MVDEKKGFGVEADWLLEALVSAAETGDGEGLRLTLAVGGQLVSGTVIGSSEFYRSLGVPSGIRQEIAKAKLLEPDIRPPRHVHLRDARVFQAGGSAPGIPATGSGVLLRVRLSQVDAFTQGILEGNPSQAS